MSDKSEPSIWRQAADLIRENGWTTGAPVDGNGCYCAGGAIAKVLVGDPDQMYHSYNYPELKEAFHKFADHVGRPRDWYDDFLGETVEFSPDERVYGWNDTLRQNEDADPKGAVLKALDELDALESAK